MEAQTSELDLEHAVPGGSGRDGTALERRYPHTVASSNSKQTKGTARDAAIAAS
jgi:hypothetical protein